MKRNKADIAFSNYIRERDNWKCQRCHRQFDRDGNTQGLHNSHYKGRRSQAGRYDPDNCTAICYGCHQHFDEHNRPEYTIFKKKQLGEKRYKEMTVRINGYKKKDDKMNYLIWKQAYYDLCKEKIIQPRKV